jgi:hypothetical protein
MGINYAIMEREIDVKPIKVNYICDKCLVGTMESTGIMLLSEPAQYPHVCSNQDCKTTQTLNKEYPFITYRI